MSVTGTMYCDRPASSWLYHYTSKSGLLGIFGSGAVWATSIHYMNDAKEFRHAMELVNLCLRELSGLDDADRSLLSTIINELMESISKIYVFVFSLSEESDLLSQWRGYSGTGGFAIEFEWERLLAVAAKNGFKLGRCIYAPKEQQEVVNPLVKSAKEVYLECLKSNLKKDEISKRISKDFIGKFVSTSPLLKHYAFSEEKEWRLISPPTRIDSPHVKYREGASMIIPYFNLKIQEEDGSFPVSGIVVGPCPHPELAANAATNFIWDSGSFKNLSVRHSRAPYREW